LFISCVFSNRTPIYGNYQLVNQQIIIDDYDNIILSVPAEVFYKQYSDSAPYLQIRTDENIFNALDIRVENHQLIIAVKRDSIIKPSMFTIYTNSHNLNQVSVVGSGNIHLKGEVNAKDFNLSITGSGNLQADSLICDQITAKITGSGDALLTGASNHSSYTITGSGNIHAFDYLVQEMNGKIYGSGNIEAFITKQLDVEITGSGNLSYRGDPPSINKRIIGSGRITSMN